MRQELNLKGMSCGHCVMAVKEVLSSIPGIEIESVEIGRAVISGADLKASLVAIKAALEEEGYPIVESTILS